MAGYKFEIFTSEIEKNIKEGIFKPGYKLPSVRAIKEKYQISISTVQVGYEHLILRGLVESIPKSGYYVCNNIQIMVEPLAIKHKLVVRDPIFSNHLALTTSLKKSRKISEFNVAAPGNLVIPQKLLLRTMQQVIREKGARLLQYYPADGLSALKENIAKRSVSYKTRINTHELLITDGALQALFIALSAVCSAGDVIALESPSVFSVLEVIRILRLKVIEIPVDYKIGFDVDFFRKACEQGSIKALVITPNFHNPTGIMLSDEQKMMLLNIAQKHNIAVVENDIYGDLYFHGQRPSTIKSFDESGLVLTYSSYAKTLAPGIRLGWLSSGQFMARTEQVKFALGSTVSPLYQEVVSRLLEGSSYDRHVRAFRIHLAKNAQLAINLLSTYFGENAFVITPAGGYNLWVKMAEKTDMNYFYGQCEKIGIRFTPGYTFSFSSAYDKYFRLVFVDTFDPKSIEAIKLLGQRLA
ncbi:PLP-dependent aminotransferase family protein [Sphingobacterium sp. DR205]|uniref:aminotransferase-like domain-containing protein n=1 Tax=Sphingobacterium sp. DR205 TaxID=2713573 RepID=UPI0013E49493|nr:PLP-dependent aminotransferase family protein [Sphingobacterium sp. DR205]QIH34603.1 PLP-dependent aminotransferase family protein [Sphingobacterium sp. DR205]